ncbi:hypothetical protein PT273_00485 [Orbaceae bacterium ESL0727]|nr:hypothetical protein [Orbaceae bacterium ESL0727]
MDLTYFIEHQCNIVIRGIQKFKETYEKAIIDIQNFDKWIWESGLYKKLNEKQRIVFNIAKSKITTHFTATSVANMLDCSYNTSAKILQGLVTLNIFTQKKSGRETIYLIRSKRAIKEMSL